MAASNVIALLSIIFGGGGVWGGIKLIARLTRIAVAIEDLIESNKSLVGKVADHETRLTRGGL